MGNLLTSFLDWLDELIEGDNERWYHHYLRAMGIIKERERWYSNIIDTYVILVTFYWGIVVFVFQDLVTTAYIDRREKQIEKKLIEVRRSFKALKATKSVFYKLNFSYNEIRRFSTVTNIEKLNKAIEITQDAMKKKMTLTYGICEQVQPFIMKFTGGKLSMGDMELKDLHTLLQLFAKYLQEPVRGPLDPEDIIPMKKFEELQAKLKNLDKSIVLRSSAYGGTLKFISRKCKVREIQTALKDMAEELKLTYEDMSSGTESQTSSNYQADVEVWSGESEESVEDTPVNLMKEEVREPGEYIVDNESDSPEPGDDQPDENQGFDVNESFRTPSSSDDNDDDDNNDLGVQRLPAGTFPALRAELPRVLCFATLIRVRVVGRRQRNIYTHTYLSDIEEKTEPEEERPVQSNKQALCLTEGEGNIVKANDQFKTN